MGRPKREMKRIHKRKLRAARKKIKETNPSEHRKLPVLSKKILKKRKRHQKANVKK